MEEEDEACTWFLISSIDPEVSEITATGVLKGLSSFWAITEGSKKILLRTEVELISFAFSKVIDEINGVDWIN
jgi:hypothetical protein